MIEPADARPRLDALAMADLRIALAIAIRPWLWWAAIRMVFRLAADGWWRRPPFLPLPSSDYLRFRLETAYGDTRIPPAADVIDYVRWCRAFPRTPW